MPGFFSLLESEFLITAAIATVVMAILAGIPANRPVRGLKNFARVIAIILAFALVWINGAAYFGQNLFMYYDIPYFPENYALVSANPEFDEVQIDLAGKKVAGGWIWKNVGTKEKSPLFIYFGGNGEESTSGIESFKSRRFAALEGYNVMMIDFPQYGLSKGTKGENGIYELAQAAYKYAQTLPYVDEDRIVVGGYSLGSGTAVRVAAEFQPKALLLISPFQNGKELVYGFAKNSMDLDIPIPILIRNTYKSEKYADKFDKPTLVISSHNDKMISLEQSEALNKHFSNSEFLVRDDTTHNSYWSDEVVVAKIAEFLKEQK